MKKIAAWTIGGAAAFLVLCLALPGDQSPKPVELCGKGRELKDASGGQQSDQFYYDIACDHAKSQAMADALYRQQHGNP